MGRAGSRLRVRRRREGRTDYHRRLKLLRSGECRAIVRVTNRRVIVQISRYSPDGDEIIVSVDGEALVRNFSWPKNASKKSIPACYLVGYAAGKIALREGINTAVLDIGLATSSPGNRRYSALNGLKDAGMEIPHNESILPSEKRLHGEHIDASLSKKVEASKSKIDEVIS